jgi:hypothetical protein
MLVIRFAVSLARARHDVADLLTLNHQWSIPSLATKLSDSQKHSNCPRAKQHASAKGAEYESQGRARSASPLVHAVRAIRPEGPEYMKYYALSGLAGV